ncbi:MAG: DASS family sodium-coupled anion symporter [Flavobacteriia bacterium]|nr:DASS family sodium-coupled anion symporter [Flavobacteriia bacterium]PIV95957.1 MAG: transporter [Flavobacteriaceae bacterium CG17_big_fil_post_rev_8_21_14_2_50_31_13]PIX13567.1 MAG: transporter [Flavobacteriaceae bacterium CG_4_8_14_3_um_filter_31_8]PIY16292.1 MAG: transporter [Flavobacteriaceae bacterium CG_4_10_14_3_um_filter_31_253]PIZ11953.1 MAG: transporter [Flavobacteriaceae bacterium CG_4_10_14_0_8_um_filter_31_99]PJC10003.1 MAG: transporter [Flavobacteriaceae bacterium CG_4_9_14_0_
MSDSRTFSLSKFTKKIERQTKIIFFLTTLLISFFLVYVLRDEGFTSTQDYTMFLLFVAIGLWITEAIPPFAVGILIIGFLVFSMGRNPDIDVTQYVQTWSDGVIWLFLGGFFLAESMRKTKLDESLLKFILPKLGNDSKNILLGIMLVTAVLSMLMSNTATTSMILASIAPLIITLGKDSSLIKSLIVGVPAAASLGGMGTIIGSAPNAIAVGALEGVGVQISFIEWMIIGVPAAFLLVFLFFKLLERRYQLKTQHISLDFLSAEIEKPTSEDKIKKNIVLLVLIATLTLWLTSQWTGIPVAVVSGVPIVLLTMLGIVDSEDVRRLPWDTLMLVAGGLSLGLAIKEQGIAEYFVQSIQNFDLNYYILIVLFGYVSVLLSNFMSNTAATTILVPVGISLVSLIPGANVAFLPVIIGLTASCALLLPVSTPPNAVAFSLGIVGQKEFLPGGLFIGIIGPVILILFTILSFFLFGF